MPDLDRRRFLSAAAATVVGSQLGVLDLHRRLETMTGAMSETLNDVARTTDARTDDIRPFHVSFPDSDLADLRRRIKATKWPEVEQTKDEAQGVQLATMQKLAQYWSTDHDWKKAEAKINGVPHFITNIDGLDIHFIHVKSKEKNAMPIIITHGWPGSFIEQMKVIGPLTDPTAHGGKAEDAFDVVIPSLPGYGFSGKPTAPGWHPARIATAWTTLMRKLGYKKFVAQGGDWGNAVSEIMALQAPPELLGISTNMAATVPPEISKEIFAGAKPPETLTADERKAWNQLSVFYGKGLGYAQEMSLKPQTLYAIADSPVGLAAWILDHDIASYLLIRRVFDGASEGLTKDDILDNITMYWLTNTAISSARLYWNTSQVSTAGFFDPRGVKLPVVVTVFPDEIYAAPQTWAEKAYSKMIYYKRFPKGGHFAAWEQPESFTTAMREGFRSLR
jgi:pimeloyl-ACP methyl ester carboxylesterase